ncbi:MAG: 3-hydroxyacyl-CoA dehydrogenase [Rhizobiaceae bacterium]|nr:3-hydroxyacyl-CoA dehydrogenase [Rhizobiaceae bacterium]
MKVAIVGTGLIGRGWAAAFARAGWQVSLWDNDPVAPEAAMRAVAQSLLDMETAGLVADAEAAASLLRPAPTLEEALAGADYAQESAPENRDIKAGLFAWMDAVAAPDVPLCSSTSAIPGSAFLKDVKGRHRCIVAHPANPPHLMPVVEVAPAPWNTPEFVQQVCDLLASIRQVPVLIEKEIEGFVMNRLQAAVINEAMALVANGVVSPSGLDAVMKHSLGLRWSMMGPFETMDLNAPSGFFDYATRYGHLYAALGRTLTVADEWQSDALQRIEEWRRSETPKPGLPERMRWRDVALMRLMALKQEIAPQTGEDK